MTISCLLPASNAPTTIYEMFTCIGIYLFGSMELATIFLFVAILFMMWVNRIPMQAALPLGIGLSAAFYLTPQFSMFFLLGLLVVGAFTVFAFMKLARGGQG